MVYHRFSGFVPALKQLLNRNLVRPLVGVPFLVVCGRYAEVNSGRNPFRGTEYWVIPMIIAFASYVARWIADLSCSA